MKYRAYQEKLVRDLDAALEEHRAVCAVLPTGGGKTVCFSGMAAALDNDGHSAWALAHREELVDQMSSKFLSFGVRHGIVKSGMPLSPSRIQVGMIQTIKNKLNRMNPPDLLVIDECHHTPASQYAAIIAAMPPETRIVGFTATPERLDGKGLNPPYTCLVQGPAITDLIGMGFLVPPIVYAPKLIDTSELHIKYGDYLKAEAEALLDEPSITGDCIEHYNKLAPGTSAIAFCVSVSHAIHVAARFSAAGIPASHIDGGMPKAQRASVLAKFRAREILVLTSADLVSEGFDCPGIETCILLRPTKSLSLYLQQVGRALRVDEERPSKTKAIILDHVQNTLLHGLPTMHRDWSIEGAAKRSRAADPDDFAIRTCSVCLIVYTGKVCPECKVEELRKDVREIEVREGELIEVRDERRWLSKEEIAEARLLANKYETERFARRIGVSFEVVRNALIRTAETLDDLKAVARALGYASAWAQHRYEGRHGKNDGQMRIAT